MLFPLYVFGLLLCLLVLIAILMSFIFIFGAWAFSKLMGMLWDNHVPRGALKPTQVLMHAPTMAI